MQANPQEYLKSWNQELSARADRVRQLIGDAHWYTDGSHKEKILKEFIESFTSSRFTVGGGFVTKLTAPTKCSTEIDILISDFNAHPPFFNEGGIQIIPPESLVAHLESKSTFNKAALKSALRGIARVQDVLISNHPEVWRGICFASTPESRCFESYLDTVKCSLEELIAEKGKEKDDDLEIEINLDKLPLCIATYSPFVSFVSSDDGGKLSIKSFEYEELGVAILMNDLFEHLKYRSGFSGDSAITSIIENIPYINNKTEKINL